MKKCIILLLVFMVASCDQYKETKAPVQNKKDDYSKYLPEEGENLDPFDGNAHITKQQLLSWAKVNSETTYFVGPHHMQLHHQFMQCLVKPRMHGINKYIAISRSGPNGNASFIMDASTPGHQEIFLVDTEKKKVQLFSTRKKIDNLPSWKGYSLKIKTGIPSSKFHKVVFGYQIYFVGKSQKAYRESGYLRTGTKHVFPDGDQMGVDHTYSGTTKIIIRKIRKNTFVVISIYRNAPTKYALLDNEKYKPMN